MLTLRSYQLEAIDFLAGEGGYLGDDPGLGKTATILSILRSYAADITKPMILVVGGSYSLGVWEQELEKWLSGRFRLYYYQGPNRVEAMRKMYQTGGVMLINYASVKAMIQETGRLDWNVLVIDEAHTYRTRSSNKYRFLEKLRADRTYALSGSPIVSRVVDLWNMLHVIDRKRFPSYWRFVDEFFFTQSNGFGSEVIGIKPGKREDFSELLRQYIIRRTEAQVASQLPEKIRQAIPLTMTSYQQEIYSKIRDRREFVVPGQGVIPIPNILTMDLRLRQLLISPKLLGLRNESAMLSALAEYLDLDFAASRCAVIFTPFNDAIPLVRDVTSGLGAATFELVGGTTPQQFSSSLATFRRHEGRKVLIAQIAVAQAWSATEAQSAYFLGFDWDAAKMLQAEKRLHREGQVGTVFIRYFMHQGTIDDHIMQVLDGKYTQAQMLETLVTMVGVGG